MGQWRLGASGSARLLLPVFGLDTSDSMVALWIGSYCHIWAVFFCAVLIINGGWRLETLSSWPYTPFWPSRS